MLAELEFGKYPSYVNNRDWFSAYAHQVMFLQHPAFLRVVDVYVDERDQWVLIREAGSLALALQPQRPGQPKRARNNQLDPTLSLRGTVLPASSEVSRSKFLCLA